MNKKQFAITLICAMGCAFIGGLLSQGLFHGNPVMAMEKQQTEDREFSLPEGHFLGVVEKGKFRLLVPRHPLGGFVRLTGIQMQEARPPETAELDLGKYEAKAIMVHGHGSGGWIYRAAVIDSGGAIITALVQKVFYKSL